MPSPPPAHRKLSQAGGGRIDHSAGPLIVVAGATALLSAGDAGQKLLTLQLPIAEVIFLRYLLGTVLATAIVLQAELRLPPAQALLANLPRLLCNGLAAFSFLYAAAHIPLAVAVTVFYSAPFYIVLFGRLILGERISARVAASMVLGFVGVVVTVGDQLLAGPQVAGGLALAAALASAPANAMAVVLLRRRTMHESTKQLVFMQNSMSALLFAPLALMDWHPPQAADLSVSALIAGIAVAGHLMLVHAFSRALAARLAVIEYSGLIWAALFGLILFGEPVSLSVIVGGSIIGISGIVLIRGRPSVEEPHG